MTTKELRDLIENAFYYESEQDKNRIYISYLEMYMNDMAEFELAMIDLKALSEDTL